MTLQDAVWTIALVGIGLVTLGFLFVLYNAGKPADDAETRKATNASYAFRRVLFWLLVVGYIGGSWATLHKYPIPSQRGNEGDRQVVDVVAFMWAWKIEPKTMQTGTPVEFHVTSNDVNHGFGVYTPDGRIVTQTQAMPGYTNILVHTFDEPGTYTIQCLEFCGVGHAPMKTTITVVAAGAE